MLSMDWGQRRGLLVGGAAALAVLAVLFVVVGTDRVVESLLSADPALVAATFGLALCWLVTWSLMLRTVLGSLDISLGVTTAFLVYAGAVFANNVTPFGQAGGEPVAAALISRVSGSRYESSLVGIASVDVLNVVPSLSLVLLGVGYYATTAAVGERLEVAVTVAVALIAVIVTVIGLVWRFRRTVVERLPAAVGRLVGGFDRFDAERVTEGIGRRLRNFFADIERVGTSPGRLAAAVGLSLTGWLFQSAALVVAFAAVGASIPPAVALFAVPLAYVAGATPLPGGLGGIEAAFVALLVPTTGVPASAVTAAVLVFRGGVYWMPVAVGGVSASVLGVRTVR